MAGAGLLGTPAAEGGLGDEQAMRILMLLARTGRRVSEICMLDHDPLLPLHPPGSGGRARRADGFVARLRYQQTKIDGAPDTILVDREIVAIIHAQQDWLRRARPDAAAPKYLFVAAGTTATATGPTRIGGCASGSASWPAGSTSATAPALWWISSALTGSATPRPQPCSTPVSRCTSCSATSGT